MTSYTDWLPEASSAMGIYRGAASRNPLAQTRAGLQAAKLYGHLSGSSAFNSPATGALDALNIYSGIRQGGLAGYGKAGASGLQLAGLLGNNPALSAAGGYLAVPLAAYNFGKNWQSGKTGSEALQGAELGASVGSVVPVVGTALGAVIGGAAGALSSAFGPGAKDPETYAVQNVINAVAQNKNNPNVAAQAADPYLELAGLMDRRSSTLPMYQQYGRMGEQRFTNDLVSQLNAALKSGQISASDPTGAYNKVVAPWVNKMGSGYSNVGPEYTATTQGLLEDMTNQYLSGQAAQAWKSIGGQEPFADIYQNSPIHPVSPPAPTAAPVPYSPAGAAGIRPMLRAQGGKVKNNLRAKLHRLSKRNYDDGGSVDTSGFDPTAWEGDFGNQISSQYDTPTPDPNAFTPTLSDPYGSDLSSLNNPSDSSPLASLAYGDLSNYLNASNDPAAYSGPMVSPGILSSLLGGGGGSGLAGLIKQYAPLAPLIAAAFGSNKPASAPSTPAGYGSIPSIPTPSYSRPYTQPNVANWYTYGQGPEQSFFGNNQLPTVPGVSPASAPAGGQMTTQPVPYSGGPAPGLQLRAKGGSLFDSHQGDDYVHDPGHGDGTSDDIDAKLSGGEYVMDAGTVSMLGNGSNEAGARALDQLRQRIRVHAGKHLVKGKQFMKAKAPEAYLKGGKS